MRKIKREKRKERGQANSRETENLCDQAVAGVLKVLIKEMLKEA